MKSACKALLVTLLVMSVFGCASRKLQRENEELKSQLLQRLDAQAAAEADAQRLADEKATLEAELAKTRSDYAARTAEIEEMSKKLAAQGFDVSVREGMVVITMPQKVLYASGSAVISSSGRGRLQQLAAALNGDFKDFSIEIQGHTDTDPISRTKDKYKSNWELSYARAQTVAYHLMTAGKVSPKRVHVAAYGQQKPVASNTSSAGKAKNRRVEILVIRPTGR